MGHSYHHGDTRNACINASLKLMDEEGLDAVTLRKVAEIVGVSRTAPYRHFANKRDLLAACAAQGFNIIEKIVANAVEQYEKKPIDQLYAGSYAYVHFGTNHPHLYRLMFNSDISEEEYPNITNAGVAAMGVPITCLEKAHKLGVMRKMDVQIQAFTIWSSLHGIVMLRIGRPTRIVDTITVNNSVESILKTLLEGLLI